MSELKKTYLLIQSNILKNDIREAIDSFNCNYNRIKDIKEFQNFIVSVISTLAHKLQGEFSATDQNQFATINTNDVIELSDICFGQLIATDIQPWQNSLYVIIRYLLFKNCVSEAVRFCDYLLKSSYPSCDIFKHLVQLFTHDIYKRCPVNDNLKKLNVILMWDTALKLIKCHTGKEIEYILHSLTTLVKNINGTILHEGKSMDLVLLDMTWESVLSTSVFRKKSDEDNMMKLYSMLIESIAAIMQNMMKCKQVQLHYLIKHVGLMIDVCSLNKMEKDSLTFLLQFFKFINNSIKNGLDSSIELRKMVSFIKKHEPNSVLENTLLHIVFKAVVATAIKLKNLWCDHLTTSSQEATLQTLTLLHYLIDFSKYSSLSKTCCKSKNCDLNEDSTTEMSLINIAFIVIRHIIPVNPTYLCSEEIFKWMELFNSVFLHVSKSSCSNKTSFVEFSLTSAYNLCINMISGEFFHTFLDFLDKLYSMFDPNGIDINLVARVAMLLSRYLYADNKVDDAFRCIAYWCGRTKTEIAAQQWVHLKCKEEKNNHVIDQTILKMIKEDSEVKRKWPEYNLSKDDCIEIMWLELKAHNNRNRLKQDTTVVLDLFDSLLSHKLPTELKSRVIIVTAYIILHSDSINGLKKVMTVLEDFTRVLELKTAMNKSKANLMIGNMYYAQFMCSLKNLQNQVCKELDSYTEERQEPGIEQQNSLHYPPMAWIVPLKIQPKLFSCLNQAVENWSKLEIKDINNEYDLQTLYASLREIGYVFKLHCDAKEVEVWKLLYDIASARKCDKYMFIALMELMKICETDVAEASILAKKLPSANNEYKLALATSFLNISEFSEAQKLLASIGNDDLKDNAILMAEYCFLKSRLSFETWKFDQTKALSVFIEAYSIAHNLVKRLDSFYEYLAMHFLLLNICSYLNLIYINTLRPAEARCFLKVQMNIVLKSVLTKRALNVFSMNCWNELVCCNFENFSCQLEHIMTLLDFKEDDADLKMQKLTIHNSPNVLNSPLSDYRCMPNPRPNRMASPSLKKLNNNNFQMSLVEFCNETINRSKPHEPVVMYSVIEACVLKAVYCSKSSQRDMAETYFKLAFKLIDLSSLQFNKNEVYNVLQTRQNIAAKYYYAEHMVLFNNENQSLNYVKKSKKNTVDSWISLYAEELDISLKLENIMGYVETKVIHSPIPVCRSLDFKTPARTRLRVKATPVVRKLRMKELNKD
ncbi:uncharacterized protein LOC126844670 isoform X2 [Adelges cooleyi]|nr:uncharacterized protein LOC126844670 isoform X2 [Adelges cooleyi]